MPGFGLGVGLPLGGGGGLPFGDASFGADFALGQYQLGGARYATAPTLPGWTFTRASTGYAETAAGALVAFASGAPRITDKGLLVEEARTNLLLQSQTFDNASWTSTGATISANAAVAPDGTTTADRITSAGSLAVLQSAVVASTSCTLTCYVKKGSGASQANRFGIRNSTTATDLVFVRIDLDTGAITYTVGASGGSSTAMGNGWWRVVVTVSTGITSGDSIISYVGFVGAATSGQYADFWGAQLEAGAFPTSYIPTTTASATRAADVASISGLSIPAPFTLVAEYVKNGDGNAISPRVMSLEGATIEHSLYQRASTQSSRLFVTSTVDLTIGTGSLGAISKLAGRFETNNVNGAFNGTAGTADTTATVQTGVSAYFGTAASVNPMLGYIRRAFIYPYAMTDAQLQAATA